MISPCPLSHPVLFVLLHDIIHDDLDIGDYSIECQFERNYGIFIDGNVIFGGLVQD